MIKKFSSHEIRFFIVLLLFALIIPFLPNKTIDAWHLFNPRNFAILIATIAAIQFTGYLAIQIFGEKPGIALTGFLGGIVSSTAVFATLPNTLKLYPQYTFAIMACAVLATVAMLFEIMTIILVASHQLLIFILIPMLTMALMGLIIAFLLLNLQKIKDHPKAEVLSPLNLSSILKTSIFIGIILIIVAIAKQYAGTQGTELIAFLSGFFEIHGISLATALLFLQNQLSLQDARNILFIALFSSFLTKFFLLWTLTSYRFALQTSLLLLSILCSGGLVYWISV